MAELLTTTVRTVEPGALAAANRFIVPITLISCIRRLVDWVGSTIRNVCRIVSMPHSSTIRDSIE